MSRENNDFTEIARIILDGGGGPSNVTTIDNCITRLRLEVKDQALVNEKKIKSAGGAGVVRPSTTAVQVLVGTKVPFVADQFKNLCTLHPTATTYLSQPFPNTLPPRRFFFLLANPGSPRAH